jgi:hypothetical protein
LIDFDLHECECGSPPFSCFAPHREYFVLCRVVVPLAHDLVGRRVVQGGEGLVGELANQVLGAVDFKRSHGLVAVVTIHLVDIYFKMQSIFYITFQKKKYKRNVTVI